MRLVGFAVRSYRSIAATAKLPLKDSLTVLIGPNNEGKSNILRALVTAMEVVSRLAVFTLTKQGIIRSYPYGERIYRWEQDFPISLQEDERDGQSEFDLEFELTEDEIREFTNEVRSSLNGTLPIRISIGKKVPLDSQSESKGLAARHFPERPRKLRPSSGSASISSTFHRFALRQQPHRLLKTLLRESFRLSAIMLNTRRLSRGSRSFSSRF